MTPLVLSNLSGSKIKKNGIDRIFQTGEAAYRPTKLTGTPMTSRAGSSALAAQHNHVVDQGAGLSIGPDTLALK